jgi:hypothetical protein
MKCGCAIGSPQSGSYTKKEAIEKWNAVNPMTNHSKRSRKSPSRNPAPAEIKRLRELADNLSQTKAAKLVHSSIRA